MTTVTAASPAALDAALDGYAAQIAHQLGEATALLGAGLFVDGPAGERSTRAALDRLRVFVSDLQELRAAGAATIYEPWDLAELLAAAAQRVGELPGGDELELACDGDMPAVAGDREALVRALAQLLRSATSSAPGSVGVVVRATADGTRVHIELTDRGGVVADDDAARLFDPFARPRGRGPLVGAGVGLVVARAIVAAHGGAIAAAPLAGGGLCVGLDLPEAA